MSNSTDVFRTLIEQAVETGMRRALGVNDATNRRLLTLEEAAVYVCLSEREIYNMLSNGELAPVVHGRRRMLDIRDLDAWIDRNKKG